MESLAVWDHLKLGGGRGKTRNRCDLHLMKPIPFQRWEHSWKKLPLE